MSTLLSEAKSLARPLPRQGQEVKDRGGPPRPAARPVSIRLGRVDPHLVSLIAAGSLEADRYRRLRYAVEQMHEADKATVVGVCSPVPGDGKTITAINLAGALSQDTRSRVLLLEADLRRPSGTVSGYLSMGKTRGPGLVDLIEKPELGFGNAVCRLEEFNLDVLPAGRRVDSPYEMLKSSRLKGLVNMMRRNYDYVILDAPPVVPVPDCRLIGKLVDGFLMVVAAHHTPRAMLEEALNSMSPDSLLGLVYNRDDGLILKKYGHYSYGYAVPMSQRRRRWWADKLRQQKKSVT